MSSIPGQRITSSIPLHLGSLIAAATWTLSTSILLNRNYQDSWILEGLVIQMLAVFGAYLWCAARETSLGRLALATTLFSVILSAAPALKYATVYSSSIDSAVHLASARTIFETGFVDPLSAYVDTPGFHALVAALSQIGGVSPDRLLRVVPSFLGAIVPLVLYMFCIRLELESGLARTIILLSGISLPLNYIVIGTQFTVPLFVALVIFFVLRETGAHFHIQYTLLLLLLLFSIIFWHPSTSLVLVLIFSGATLIDGVKRGGRNSRLLGAATLGATITFTYWIYSADYTYSKFIKNLKLVLQPFSSAALVPHRLFEISLEDKLIIALLSHARDATLLLLGIVGVGLLLRTGKTRQVPSVQLYATIWLGSIAVLACVFLVGFGGQGYTRFLTFVIVLSSVPSGYGLWRGVQLVQEWRPTIRPGYLIALTLPAAFAVSAIQLYPYQPAVPTLKLEHDQRYSPMVWLHQVNTVYQRRMLQFAIERLPDDAQLVGDYIGARQPILFFQMSELGRLRTISDGVSEPSAFLLLHTPGRAGGYMEQVEHRSAEAISQLRTASGASTIYDNGGSFILYSSTNTEELASIKGWR